MRGDVGYDKVRYNIYRDQTGVASPLQVLGMPSESG